MTEKFFFNGQAAAYANTRKCKTLGQKAALIQLAACCNQETLACFPSQELLAGRMCIKPRQLRTHLSGLEEADLIRRTARGNKEGGRGTDGYIIVGLREFFEDFKDNADRAYERGRSKPREDDTFRQKTASNPNRQKTAAKVGGLPAENCQGNRQKTADIKEKGKRKVLKENPLTPKGEASDAIASPAVCASPSQENEKESAKGTEPKKKGTIKPKREIPPRAAKNTRLTDDWTLPTDWKSEMAAHFGITETAVAYVAESFKDYWLGAGKAKADWKATFRNWIRKEIERNDGVKVPAGWNDGGSSDGGSADDEAYREIAMFLLGSFYRRGGEGKAAWTQKQQDFFQSCAPGLPRCTIDPELIAAARAASSSKIAA